MHHWENTLNYIIKLAFPGLEKSKVASRAKILNIYTSVHNKELICCGLIIY